MTTEEAAFWAALKQKPKDDTTRLVFADWLDDRNDPRGPWVRKKTFFAQLKGDPDAFIPALIRALGTGDSDSSDAAQTLSRMGEPAVLPLVHALTNSTDGAVRYYGERAALGLRDAAQKFLPRWKKEIAAVEPWVRCVALVGLQLFGVKAVALPHLIRSLASADLDERTLAAGVIERIGPDAAKALPHLLDALDDRGDFGYEEWLEFREHAIDAIRCFGHAAVPNKLLPRVVAHQMQSFILGANHGEAAVNYLGEFGPRIAPLVIAEVDNLDREELGYAVWLLSDLGEKAIPHLIPASREKGKYSKRREVALRALGSYKLIDKLGKHTDEIVPKLIEYMGRDVIGEQIGEAFALLGARAAAAVPELIKKLKSGDERDVKLYLPYLAGIGTPEALRAVVLATDGRGKLKDAARAVLSEWKNSTEFVAAIRALAENTRADSKVRKAAAGLLKVLEAE